MVSYLAFLFLCLVSFWIDFSDYVDLRSVPCGTSVSVFTTSVCLLSVYVHVYACLDLPLKVITYKPITDQGVC